VIDTPFEPRALQIGKSLKVGKSLRVGKSLQIGKTMLRRARSIADTPIVVQRIKGLRDEFFIGIKPA
jgi:hypothetical protein